jgi:hypothetical protein
LGRPLELGENFTDTDLYDKPVVLHVDNEKTGRGTFARIVELSPSEGGADPEAPF